MSFTCDSCRHAEREWFRDIFESRGQRDALSAPDGNFLEYSEGVAPTTRSVILSFKQDQGTMLT
jgi:hypothetical protein